jgi:geranylgeranyl diphosphate synthase type I
MRDSDRRKTCKEFQYMVFSSNIQATLSRHQQVIDTALRQAMSVESTIDIPSPPDSILEPFYGQMKYHLGWVDDHFVPTKANPGKLLRPTLLLLAYEAAGAWNMAKETGIFDQASPYLRRALPAAAAIELTHNCTLVHDDIEDGDTERRHRSTVWHLWGIPQATNTGDGMYTLARLTLWKILAEGVDGETATHLAELLDRTCLAIFEGQYLDMSFEHLPDITLSMYMNMINRKTGALLACSVEMGGYLGTRDAGTLQSLRRFGWALGTAFQVRDDLLGIWSTKELGKSHAGDLYRRKKTLPVIHALEHANEHDKPVLHAIYRQEAPVTVEQVEELLAIFIRTDSRAYCQEFLAQECKAARDALNEVPRRDNPISVRALNDMEVIVDFLEEAAYARSDSSNDK